MIDYFLHTLKEESGLNSKEKDDTDYWREYIAPFNWCGIWALDIKYISQKNGEVGYDGLILYNSYLKEPFLIKNKIWEKYNQQKGPCSVIGIPSSNEAKARIEKGSRAKPNQAFYQMFEKGAYKDNAIYAYAWKEKEGVFGSKEGYDAYYTVNKVAKEYHSAGGSWSGYKFPTGDTYSDTDSNIDRYCKQWFEGGGVNFCYEGKIKEFVEKVNYYFDKKIGCANGGESWESGVDCRGLALLPIRDVTNKTNGDPVCGGTGLLCDPKKHIPSTDSHGLLKNKFPVFGGSANFPFTYETTQAMRGGLTIYDWDPSGKDGFYDHVNIIVDVDSRGYRTWVYSGGCAPGHNVSNHLRKVYEGDLYKLRDKIKEKTLLADSDNKNITRIGLVEYSYNDRIMIKEFIDKNRDFYKKYLSYSEEDVNRLIGQLEKGVTIKNVMWKNTILN